jgi:hypothetical protein
VKYQGKGRMGQLFRYKLRFGKKVPHIVYDGIVDDKTLENGQVKAENRICVRNNQGGSFVNIDAANNFKNVSRDATAYDCTQAALKQAAVSMK